MEAYLAIGRDHGIPEAEVRRALGEGSYEDRIRRETAEAHRYEVRSPPTSFVNGRRITGARDFESFRRLVDQALAGIED